MHGLNYPKYLHGKFGRKKCNNHSNTAHCIDICSTELCSIVILQKIYNITQPYFYYNII